MNSEKKSLSQSTKQIQAYLHCRSDEFPVLLNIKAILKPQTHKKSPYDFQNVTTVDTFFWQSLALGLSMQLEEKSNKSLCHRQVHH
jgi:hypothetical protein